MKLEELSQRLQTFVAGAAAGRHVYAFSGSADLLEAGLTDDVLSCIRRVSVETHLLDAIPSDTSPGRMKTCVADAFTNACRKWADERTRRSVIILTDIELLARYQVELASLYSYWVGDQGACVIACKPVPVPKPLSYLSQCLLSDETATWRYIVSRIGADVAVLREGK